MSETRSDSRVRRIGDGCLIVLFCVVLVLPTLDWLFHLDRSPTPNENRTPAPFPAWHDGSGSLQAFVSGLESWFNDHFGFRKKLVRMHNRWKAKLFKQSSSADVLVGRDGWLYYGRGRMIDNYTGARLLTADDLRAWQTLLETRRDWLAKRGIGYLFVVAPNKETVYPEHLPEWIVPAGKETKLSQFVAHMLAHSSVEVLDLGPVLIDAKSTALTYHPTDSHWNAFGAFVACQALVRTLGRQLPGGLEPIPIDAFELRFVDQAAGDLAQTSGGELVLRERNTPQLTPRPPLKPLEILRNTSLSAGSGPPDHVPIYTERAGQRHRIVLFRDSFATAWTPFLGQHFARAVYVQQYHWDTALIERERPDVVVDEGAERLLNEGEPSELLKSDNLPR
jgi:hypothetical protein